MKNYINIFLFLFISGLSFGQDSLKVRKNIFFGEINSGVGTSDRWNGAGNLGVAFCYNHNRLFFEVRNSVNGELGLFIPKPDEQFNSIGFGTGYYLIKKEINLIAKCGLAYISTVEKGEYLGSGGSLVFGGQYSTIYGKYLNIPVTFSFQYPGKWLGMGISLYAHINSFSQCIGLTFDLLGGNFK